jgi:hypothetical protein
MDSGAANACSAHPAAIKMIDLHTHKLTVSLADTMAGVDKSYTLGGSHTHPLTITAAMFAQLRAGTGSMMISGPGGSDNHIHHLTVQCA